MPKSGSDGSTTPRGVLRGGTITPKDSPRSNRKTKKVFAVPAGRDGVPSPIISPISSPITSPLSPSSTVPSVAGEGSTANGQSGVRHRGLKSPRKPSKALTIEDEGALQAYRERLTTQRKKITFFRAPLQTLYHLAMVLADLLTRFLYFLVTHQVVLFSSVLGIVTVALLVIIDGDHQVVVQQVENYSYFAAYWIVLGIASSIGLGSGLHTFLLYLMPWIIKITLYMDACGYPDFNVIDYFYHEVTCPPESHVKTATEFHILLRTWWVLRKVWFAAFLWGTGTAIGELPPYFVARAARLAGQKLSELEEVEHAPHDFMERVKHRVFDVLQQYGFWAIVACASVPNPLFDLAGITCGHFLVPFWTFFGATFIGKAINKASGQAVFTIFSTLQVSHSLEEIQVPSGNWLSYLWDKFIIIVLTIFFISIVNSAVQERLATIDQHNIMAYEKKLKARRAKHAATATA